MDEEIIYIVTEKWDKEELEWWSEKMNGECSLICKPDKQFQKGLVEERFASAVRYYEERLNYIYTRRHMYCYLQKLPFCISLLKVSMIEGCIGNTFQITSVNQNSPLPNDFENGLFRIGKRPFPENAEK